jgi:hypothetical protein
MATDADDRAVREALDATLAVAGGNSTWATQDPVVRAAYQKMIRVLSDRIWDQYKAGKLTAGQAAEAAIQERNFILRIARMASTPEGRAQAVELKANGFSIRQLLDRYANRLQGKDFAALTESERGPVFEAIIQSAGRSNAAVDEGMRALGASARLFWVLTVLMAFYDISRARDKVTASVHLLEVVGAGIIVGEVLGGVLGSFGGPWGTGIGIVAGGFVGAWMVDHYVYDDANPALTGS